MKLLKRIGGFLLTVLIAGGCVEPYDPPVDNRDVNYLVVDAFLNGSDHSAEVTLTRTLPVESGEKIPAESGAVVRLEDDKGVFYPLPETEKGVYNGSVINASTESTYRLVIRTRNNKEYISDFIPMKISPPIDSVNYTFLQDGLQFNVNTHDPTGEVRYFRWKYRETYEYNSSFNSVYKFDGKEIVFRPPDESIYTCWRTNLSTNIKVGTTKHLTESLVREFPLVFIPTGSIKLSVKYSLLVQQQALTEEAYNYWLNLQKSTEQLGGLFDPLPSEVSSNIQCITNPAEKVVGFFGAGTVQEARKFINRRELPGYMRIYGNYNPSCELDTILLPKLREIQGFVVLVDGIFAPGAGLIGYTSSIKQCVDCTVFGGTTVKPPFWE